MHLVVGRVFRHGQLFEDDVAFGVDLVRPQRRFGQDLAEQLETELEVVRRQARVVRGVLAGGERVHLAAERVDRLRDLACGSCLRPLEHEVLEEVRCARELRGLITTSDGDPEPGRHRPGFWHRFGDDADSVGKLRPLNLGFSQRRRLWPPRPRSRPPPPPRPPRPRSPPRSPPRSEDASAGPRSPNSARNSASNESSNDTSSRSDAADVDDEPLPSPDPPPSPPARGVTGDSDTLPLGSTSSTRTWMSAPSSSTSSTRSMRLPPPIFEMCSRPSRPGRMLTNAPNLVMLTTLPSYT